MEKEGENKETSQTLSFNPDKELVKELCKSSDQFSICGFEEIASCECINNKCGASK